MTDTKHINTGGAAFPTGDMVKRNSEGQWFDNPISDAGMTMRDYFAAKAMAGALAGEPGSHLRPDNLAAESYAHADAMLAAHGGRP